MGARVTPWRDLAEWDYVKACFYPREQSVEDSRLEAVERVKAWSIRGRVPHAVLSTSMLTTAIMRYQAGGLTTLEFRMMLAMALTRFVNGLLDPAQQAAFAISMSALAKTIGLPESFVELRHSATHDTLPSLPALRTAILQGLDWLWHNYWNVLPKVTAATVAAEQDLVTVRTHFDNILKAWKRVRKPEPGRPLKSGDQDPITKQSISLLKELATIKGSPQVVQILAEKLMYPNNMLSTSAQLIELWKPLLEAACETFPNLRQTMIMLGISILGSDAPKHDIELDMSLLGVINVETKMQKIPNIEGSYDRLQTWILWLLSEDAVGDLDHSEVMRAMSVENDSFSLDIMQKCTKLKGFEQLNRLIGLRLTLPSAEQLKRELGTVHSLEAVDDQSVKRKQDQANICDTARSGKWLKIAPKHGRSIGFLIS